MTTWVWGALASLAFLARCSWPLIPRWTTRVCPSSSPRSRYFPARSIDLMVWPSRRARKCLALGWRRTVRPLRTSTVLIFRPTTSLWRSRRMVSTSGSSGIPPASLDFQRSAGDLGGDLLGVFFGSPLPRAEALASNVHRGQVPPGVIRAETLHFVAGDAPAQCARRPPAGGSCDPTRPGSPTATAIRSLSRERINRSASARPPSRYTAPITASVASARIDSLARPPDRSSPRPSRRLSVDAQVQAHLGQDPGVDHRGPDLGHLPRRTAPGGPGRCTRPPPGPRTASPRNSRRSLEVRPPCSAHHERWAMASSSRAGSLNR